MKRNKLILALSIGILLLGGILTGCFQEDEEEKQEKGAIVEGTVLTGWDNPQGTIKIPDGVTDIAREALANCLDVTSVKIPSSVENISESAFTWSRNLKSVEFLGSGLKTIGQKAFRTCEALVSLTLPDTVTSIGEDAFYDCKNLLKVDIPNSVNFIGSDAYRGCSSLRSLTIGTGVETLWNCTFYKCSSLTSVTIPDTVTTIAGDIFTDCHSLTTVNVTGTWTYGDGSESKNKVLTVDDLKQGTWKGGRWTRDTD